LIANEIANIRSVRTLIATGGRMAGRKTVLFVPVGNRKLGGDIAPIFRPGSR
jgi:hypothetical protein